MNCKILLSLFVSSSIFLSNCASTAYYHMSLVETKTPSGKLIKSEQGPIVLSKQPGEKLVFEDENLKFDWQPNVYEFSFSLLNKTSNPVKIIWDQTVYIDQEGISRKVINSNTKLVKNDSVQVPSVIIPGGIIKDSVYPAELVEFRGSREFGNWVIPAIFNQNMTGATEDRTSEYIKNTFEKKNIKIFLPVEISGKLQQYLFTFYINEIQFK